MTQTPMPVTAFKAYDIRGRLGHDLTPALAERVGRAFVTELCADRIVIGHDARESSAGLAAAVAQGAMACGAEVLDLGLCGTEEVYFATDHLGAGGGICVTASHNPIDYNGMKLVQRGAAPVGPQSGLDAIRARVAAGDIPNAAQPGRITDVSGTRAAYVAKILDSTDAAALAPLHILVNAGNGAAGPSFDALARGLAARGAPLRFTRLHHDPDPSFPNGIPNPLLPENQPVTGTATRKSGADFGVAWDGDFDRCFFFDHTGAFVPGEYVVGLLAEAALAQAPGAAIVHDPRIVWNTQEIVARAGGTAIMRPTGHTHMKAALRETGAIYGGEMSAHHYFRDFMACDSGMIPWLLVAELVSRTGRPLRDLLADRIAAYPSSGEINFRVDDPKATIARIETILAKDAEIDRIDGLSLSFPDWRMNLRASNTEPLLRLNIEARSDAALVAAKLSEITALIRA